MGNGISRRRSRGGGGGSSSSRGSRSSTSSSTWRCRGFNKSIIREIIVGVTPCKVPGYL